MQSFRLAINYNGRWDNLDYVDGKLIGEWVENKLSYNELVEMTYKLIGIDRNSDTEDEKPNEHDYPISLDDTFIGVEDGIGGTKNCGGAGEITFGGPSHDPFPAAPSCWILPCVGQYSFGTTPAASTSQEGPLFVGQVFMDKHKLKIELGLYAMRERKKHCIFWHVKKFIKTHTCEGDMYGRQFQAASANVIGQLYAHKLSSGANIYPKYIMRDIREKHGVELLYTKAWMAMQHARSTVYGKNLKKEAPKRCDVLQLYKLVAYSYKTEVCDKYLTDISNIHRRAFDYLVDVGVERWSLAYCPEKRYEFITMNIAEAINSTAKEARKLPITTLV
ncbi:hypothetical protein Ddye_012865 [Dipteronia dyeriana]|uniref:Uncharacterized protein n=1 Tax=Dipteronia dyeriana TaxID=168575 RepID=A0AAD9X579_9ROSI|nr:hypothetical protein Ddye_012865 [Dipteronia dyeriana]